MLCSVHGQHLRCGQGRGLAAAAPPTAPGALAHGVVLVAMHERATDSKRRSISGAQRVNPFDLLGKDDGE